MNHLSCISDEALFFGCQKRNGLSGGRPAKLDTHHSFAFRDINRHGVITNLFQQCLQQTIAAKIPGLDELCWGENCNNNNSNNNSYDLLSKYHLP